MFWALRGGGAGSWGVIISATFRTYPIFNATVYNAGMLATTNASSGTLAEIHARHIFDWDDMHGGQYFYFEAAGPGIGNALFTSTYFINATADEAAAALKPLLDDAQAAGFAVFAVSNQTGLGNDLLENLDTAFGINDILGSRLIPAAAYRDNATIAKIGQGYTELFEQGTPE